MNDFSEETTRLYNEKYRCLNCVKRNKNGYCRTKKKMMNDDSYCTKIEVKKDFRYKS